MFLNKEDIKEVLTVWAVILGAMAVAGIVLSFL